MINIAILGFGVVGSGVAEVISTNAAELAERLDGEQLNIKHILDLRTFPEHPLGDRVTADFDVILNDEDVFLVVETMGGSHPAYEFSKKAMLAGKNVVTSNKEVVQTTAPSFSRSHAKTASATCLKQASAAVSRSSVLCGSAWLLTVYSRFPVF